MADDSSEWLPRRGHRILAKTFKMRFIREKKSNDWFFALASAIEDRKKDKQQSRMLAKLYIFLREYCPRGLTGDLAHVHGADVMRFLSDENQHAVSRNKLAKQADSSWTELEAWMAQGKSWNEARDTIKSAMARGLQNGMTHKAPGLFSPPAILALLVISHPDDKLRARIQRLQIEWMLRPRESLAVHDGYWSGINSGNIYDVFEPEKSSQHNQSWLLADYSVLLGEKFVNCRRNMRPFLPDWAERENLSLDGGPDLEDLASDSDEGTLYSTGATETTEDDMVQRRRILWPETTKSLEDVKHWLVRKLGAGDSDKLLFAWCETWAADFDKAETYEQQLIVQSLFAKSLQRLETFYDSDPDSREAYLALDIGSAGSGRHTGIVSGESVVMGRLEKMPAFQPFADADEALGVLVAGLDLSAAPALLRRTSTQRRLAFCNIMRHPHCFVLKKAIALDTAHIQMTMHRIRQATADAIPIPRRLFDADVIMSLNLGTWQLRELLDPAVDQDKVLTEHQRLMLHKVEAGESSRPVAEIQPIVCGADVSALGHCNREILRKLFGQLGHSRGGSSAVLSLAPVPPKPCTKSPFIQLVVGKSRFAGKKFTPAKRPGDDLDERDAKFPRLMTLTLQDLKHVFREALQESREPSAQRQEQAADAFEIADAIRKAGTASTETFQALETAVADANQAQVTALTVIIEGAFGALRQDILTEVRNLKASLVPPPEAGPVVGGAGYLEQKCPAPSCIDQSLYVSRVLRAAWYYIHLLGDPDEGVGADGVAMRRTVECFPDLTEDHVIVGIEHVHIQAYGHPFSEDRLDP